MPQMLVSSIRDETENIKAFELGESKISLNYRVLVQGAI
ncbi:MAG: hypothetical protein Ct9H300mP4_15220 [Gammaproteobacteria bacterium]|nr:MAG: hypothetical protein Ct9H300mP4_15220 [Gammaproteobacteria bacterium]